MTQKKCSKCSLWKDLSEFHNCKVGKYRKQSQCKICKNLYNKTISHKTAVEKYRLSNKKKYIATNKVNNSLRDGKIIKPNKCQFCGKVAALEGHHLDYDNPLDIVWLCVSCHKELHNVSK